MKKRSFPYLVLQIPAVFRNACFWALAIALGVAFAIPTFSQTSRGYEIPFESSRVFGLKTIRVEANGKPAVLIVDTASNHTILRSDFELVRKRTSSLHCRIQLFHQEILPRNPDHHGMHEV